MKLKLGTLIAVILLGILFFLASSLMFWGICNLAIWTFKINYEWTLLHGLVCAIICMVLQGVFSKG